MYFLCFRTAITNATIHSRPPSYRSHSSDYDDDDDNDYNYYNDNSNKYYY